MKIARPVLRYHGAKFRDRHRIIACFWPHSIYTEDYGGGASVLLAKPRPSSNYGGEVYNDKDGMIVRLFRTLREPEKSERLIDALKLTPFARDEYEAARAAGDLTQIEDDVEAARLLILRSFLGHGSDATAVKSNTGFRAASWASNRSAPRDWINYPDNLRAVTARLQGVVIENRPAVEVMLAHDGPETLHYLDPPYLPETCGRGRTRRYDHDMTREEHVEMATVARQVEGQVVVSGYHSPLYDELFDGWHRREWAALADGSRARVEVVWSNRPFPGSLFQ